MSHVDKEISSHGIGDLSHPCKIDGAGVGGGTSRNHLGLIFLCCLGEQVVVDRLLLFGYAVVLYVIELSGEIGEMSVCEVPPVGKVHRQDFVAWLQHAEVNGSVRLRARVWLNVSEPGSEEFLRSLDRQDLGLIDFLATSIPTLAWISLGILVREATAPELAEPLWKRNSRKR
jgi:hypothetical protein